MPESETGQTESITRAVQAIEKDSAIWGVSVRAWLVVMLVSTLCLVTLMNPVLSYLITGDIVIEIKEPFYSAVTISLGYFFGQSGKK